jgi:hypothetical protein
VATIAAGNKKEAWRIVQARLQAAEAYELRNQESRKKNGPLGHVGIEVLRQLYRMVDFKTGRLEPSIEPNLPRDQTIASGCRGSIVSFARARNVRSRPERCH